MPSGGSSTAMQGGASGEAVTDERTIAGASPFGGEGLGAQPETLAGRIAALQRASVDAHATPAVDESEARRLAPLQQALQSPVDEEARVQSLSVMAAGVAHDFNNLLTVVLAHIAFAAEGLPPDAVDARASLATARQAAEAGAALSGQILAYSGRAVVHAVSVDVGELVSEMAPSLRGVVGDRAILRLVIPTAPTVVSGDTVQLRQLVLALVTNAAEAMTRGRGIITIGVRAIASEAPGRPEQVELEVEDDGAGMDESTRKLAFDPFFSTKFVGRGMGLAVVAGNVKAHGGSIALVSALGGGTTVRVRLPAGAAPGTAISPSRAPSPFRGTGLFLVVDDEPQLRKAMARMLRGLGFTTVEADGGHAAVQMLASSSEPIVGVLLDLTMPGMGGGDTLRAIRGMGGRWPVVLTSGYAGGDAIEALRAQADGFLAKPFRVSDLSDLLQRIPAFGRVGASPPAAAPSAR